MFPKKFLPSEPEPELIAPPPLEGVDNGGPIKLESKIVPLGLCKKENKKYLQS